jgi:proline racemase
MNFKQMIQVIDAHTAGDPLRLVTVANVVKTLF